jgi:hypothetical protein
VSLLLLLTRNQTQAALRYVLVLFPLYGIAAVMPEGRVFLRRALLTTLLVAQVALYLAALQGVEWALT